MVLIVADSFFAGKVLSMDNVIEEDCYSRIERLEEVVDLVTFCTFESRAECDVVGYCTMLALLSIYGVQNGG